MEQLGALMAMLGVDLDSLEADQKRDERAREIAQADSPPTWCLRCGIGLDQDVCPDCGTDRREMHNLLKVLYEDRP